tara:strand:+ start:780 stop:1439 length:660 start_codon:yes stop_codon:yes gene_type:complete
MAKADLKIDWATHEAAKYACENWHYSGCMPVGKLVKVGVWESGKFIGVVLFGRGANKGLGAPFGLDQIEVCELVRIALTTHVAAVSRIMSIAIKFIQKMSEGLRLIVSFADTEQGHHGGIYQATNWLYNGQTQAADEYMYKGKRWHGRAFRKSHGSHLKYIGKGLEIVRGSRKHRYLMPLDKEMKAQIAPLAKPYPKREKQAMAVPTAQRRGSADLHAP